MLVQRVECADACWASGSLCPDWDDVDRRPSPNPAHDVIPPSSLPSITSLLHKGLTRLYCCYRLNIQMCLPPWIRHTWGQEEAVAVAPRRAQAPESHHGDPDEVSKVCLFSTFHPGLTEEPIEYPRNHPQHELWSGVRGDPQAFFFLLSCPVDEWFPSLRTA